MFVLSISFSAPNHAERDKNNMAGQVPRLEEARLTDEKSIRGKPRKNEISLETTILIDKLR